MLAGNRAKVEGKPALLADADGAATPVRSGLSGAMPNELPATTGYKPGSVRLAPNLGDRFHSAAPMKTTQRLYFPHIEGLRAVAAILVAIYHVYLGRVSGGVDVFFVVSGILITMALLGRVDGSGRLDWRGFLAGLALRLLPAAGAVLVVVALLAFALLPEVRHLETFREIVASFLYLENWMLAVQATDYLDRENVPSPVQHYWAMSMQAQFYLLAMGTVMLTLWACAPTGAAFQKRLVASYASIFVLSLAYSIYQTHFGDQV